MLAGVVRELRSHHFSHSSYIQKWSLELQDEEIGQTPGKGEGNGDCVGLQEVILSLAGQGHPAGAKQTAAPAPPVSRCQPQPLTGLRPPSSRWSQV